MIVACKQPDPCTCGLTGCHESCFEANKTYRSIDIGLAAFTVLPLLRRTEFRWQEQKETKEHRKHRKKRAAKRKQARNSKRKNRK